MTLLRLTNDSNVQLLESSSLPVGVLKGTDKMCFVSDTETFSLKVVVTSNSLLLVDQDGQSLLFKEYWELSQIPAQLTELQGLLEAVPYKGRHEERRSLENYGKEYQDSLENLLWVRLQELISSDYELEMELQKRKAFLFENYYRILDTAYLNDILNLVSLSVIEYDLDWKELSWNSLKELTLEHDIPQEVLMHSLKIVSLEYFDRDGDMLYKISMEEWAKAVAENGFVYKEWSGMSLEEFLKKWKSEVPQGFKVDIDWMAGMGYIKEEKIFYFPKSMLERDPKQRFSQLFLAKKKWTRGELIPYISDLIVGTQTKELDILLIKWTRRIKEGNVSFYMSR